MNKQQVLKIAAVVVGGIVYAMGGWWHSKGAYSKGFSDGRKIYDDELQRLQYELSQLKKE